MKKLIIVVPAPLLCHYKIADRQMDGQDHCVFVCMSRFDA